MIRRKYSLPYALLVGILPEVVDFEVFWGHLCNVVTKSDHF